MNSEQYEILKEQCYICSISDTTKDDCNSCERKQIISDYEKLEDDSFIQTTSAVITGVDNIVALWGMNEDKIYFCKEKDYVFPAKMVGVYRENVLFETTDTDLFYAIHFEERKKKLRELLKLA